MLQSYRAVLAHRVAGSLYAAAAVSIIGDFVGLAALVVVAFDRSGSAVGPGALFAVQGVAAAVGGTVLGPRLDGLNRSAALGGTYLAGAAALVLPAVVGGLWPVMTAAVVLGILRPLGVALRQAIAGAELEPELLGPLVALQKSTTDASAAIGLATGGALTILLGPTLSLGIDAATFLVAALLMLRVPPSRGVTPARGALRAGFRIWLDDDDLRVVVGVLLGLATVSALPETLAPAVAGESGWFPLVIAGQAAGTSLGALLVGHRERWERPRALVGGMVLVAVALCGGALVAASPGLLALANLLLGVALSVTVLAQTAFTRLAPPDRIGAAIASAITAIMVAEGLGSLLVSAVAARGGLGPAYLTGAAVTAVSAAIMYPAVSGRAPVR